MLVKIRNWMERFLEEPFCRAEIMRAEILKDNNHEALMNSLVGSLNHNYATIKTWSK